MGTPPAPDQGLPRAERRGYQERMKEQIHQAAFERGLAAAEDQVMLSGKAAALDTGLLAAIVLAVIDAVVEEAIRG